MGLLYTLGIFLYGFLLKAASPFNPKARQWVEGRKRLFQALATAYRDADREARPVTWFHASSLGEFEQGRPIIEAFRKACPGSRILLTFFSPSGYAVRHNYDQADEVFYLPLDTPRNALRWLQIVRPERVVFIKYDFWFNMLDALRVKQIPVFFVSVKFRPSQLFFRWYGGWFRRKLDGITWFFAQNDESQQLLHSIGMKNVSVTGDTRFDRVFAMAANRDSFPAVEHFANGQPVFICGSTWKEDEELLFPFIHENGGKFKFIIAPHDTGTERIKYIIGQLKVPVVRYSELTAASAAQASVLLVDSVGILAQLYQYAKLAYIGGGFGVAIHNIQEPVTFGVPVFFGPKYHKFREAVELVEQGGAFCVYTTAELRGKVAEIMEDQKSYLLMSDLCRRYVDDNRGATGKIMDYFLENR